MASRWCWSPPIQGIGNANGFTMQLELRDGNFDWAKLNRITQTVIADANSQSALQHVSTSYRADVPQIEVDVDRTKAETLHVSVGDVFNVLSGYIGSSYVNQFNLFGRTSRSMCRRIRNIACGPATLKRCMRAAATATWCRWVHWSPRDRWLDRR